MRRGRRYEEAGPFLSGTVTAWPSTRTPERVPESMENRCSNQDLHAVHSSPHGASGHSPMSISCCRTHACLTHGNRGLRHGPCHSCEEPEQRVLVRSRQGAIESSRRTGGGGGELGRGGREWGRRLHGSPSEEMNRSGTGQHCEPTKCRCTPLSSSPLCNGISPGKGQWNRELNVSGRNELLVHGPFSSLVCKTNLEPAQLSGTKEAPC